MAICKIYFVKCIALLILPYVDMSDGILPVPTKFGDESRIEMAGVCCENGSAPKGHTADGENNQDLVICNVIDYLFQ